MVKQGIVTNYKGEYGCIITDNKEVYDFSKGDISFGKPLQVNDIVVFRAEDKGKELKLARNVLKPDKR